MTTTKDFEVERDVFVTLSDDELASMEPKESRYINVLNIVEAGKVQ